MLGTFTERWHAQGRDTLAMLLYCCSGGNLRRYSTIHTEAVLQRSNRYEMTGPSTLMDYTYV